MLLGNVCTRRCAFCAIGSGVPGEPDPGEPERIADAVSQLGLKYCVITSVTRDDLLDRGAGHFAATVEAIKRRNASTKVELLIPDMDGREDLIHAIASSGPDVIGHNLETVRRLQPIIRDRKAGYDVSLSVLANVRMAGDRPLTKSSLMLGLGEAREEVRSTMDDLYLAGVDILSLGQYLRPRGGRLSVTRYLPPEEFEELRDEAYGVGFRHVASGPMVRSSYRAWATGDEQRVDG